MSSVRRLAITLASFAVLAAFHSRADAVEKLTVTAFPQSTRTIDAVFVVFVSDAAGQGVNGLGAGNFSVMAYDCTGPETCGLLPIKTEAVSETDQTRCDACYVLTLVPDPAAGGHFILGLSQLSTVVVVRVIQTKLGPPVTTGGDRPVEITAQGQYMFKYTKP
jgi:hypothetical protein